MESFNGLDKNSMTVRVSLKTYWLCLVLGRGSIHSPGFTVAITIVLFENTLSLNSGIREHWITYPKIAWHIFRQKFKNFLFNIQLLGISIILYICKLLYSYAHYVCCTTPDLIKLSNSEKAQYFVQLVLDWVGQKVRFAFSIASFKFFIYF